jgi:DNA-binding transcriptional LysR family regulator
MMRAAGLGDPVIASQAQEIDTIRDMVIAGMGVACSLRRAVHKDILAGTIVELDVDIEPMYLVLSYARSVRSDMPEIDSLVDMVRRAEGINS